MTSTTGNTNISNTAQIQTPNDYIEKGINELTMDYYSVVNPGKKRSIGNLVVGVGLLITANMVKTIMISLITENQKNIHKAILDGFGLLSFENLNRLTWWSLQNVRYYTVGWFLDKQPQIEFVSDTDYQPNYHKLDFEPSATFADTLKVLLEKSKQELGSVTDIRDITFDCDVSDEIKMTEKDVVITKIYKNVSLNYQDINIQFPRLDTSGSGGSGGCETMYDILNFKYPGIDYDSLKFTFDRYTRHSLNQWSIDYFLEIPSTKIPEKQRCFMFKPSSLDKNQSYELRDVILSCLHNNWSMYNKSLSHVFMTNLFFIRALFNSSERTLEIIKLIPGCRTIDSSENFKRFKTFTYNGITTRIGEVNVTGQNIILGKINGRPVCHMKQYADLELVQKVLNYSYDFANEKQIANEKSSPKLSVYLNGNSDNLFDKLLDKQTAYTTFKSFVSHLHSISKRQNTNNKIHVKTIQYKETVSEGSPNPAHASYMEQKKQLLDEKRPLAEIIALLGQEPAKTLEPVVKREITSVDISERYCSFDNLYLRKEQDVVLYNVVDSFQNDKKLMEELGIPNKLGILLHGLPGCGKTTTILTIASYFGRDVFYINLKSIKTNDELKAVFDHVNAKHVGGGIVVFEDIDAMTDATNKRAETVLEQSAWELVQETDKNNKNGGSGITLEYMLNLLDGMLTYNDSIVIITTNHLAKLDPALYRAGRMDKLIEMKKCDRYQISKIFRRFMLRDISQEVIERIEEDTFTPAEIIFHVKLYVKKRDETDETIMQPFVQ